MSREWMMYLDDMVESAELAMSFAAGLGAESFEPGQMAYDAILRRLEIIGEAASHIPQEVRNQAQDILWRDIIGLRNRLAHGYFAVEREPGHCGTPRYAGAVEGLAGDIATGESAWVK